MNGVAFMTANDGGEADAALVRRFRQAQTRRERAAAFASVVRRHRDAVLACCAERLWPDGDAAVAAAGDVFIAASRAMPDSAKLARPDLLRAWLLGIAVRGGLGSGLPARVDDISWEAVQAQAAAGAPGPRDSPAARASARQWLDQIVATLPGPRQRLYDLVVTRGLDSRAAALELGANAAEVRRLRRENRQAILRAFEVTALVAAETAPDPGSEVPGCGELRRVLADAPHDGDPREGGRRHTAVLPAALRLAVTRHLSQCVTCQEQRDDCMARWVPELLPILAGAELDEQVMEDLRLMPEFAGPRAIPGARRRAAWAGATGKVFIRRAAAAGGGLLAALLLLAFVWPGFLHGTEASVRRGSTAPSPQDPGSSRPSAPQGTGKISGVPGRNSGRQVSQGTAGVVSGLPRPATGSPAVPSSSAPQAPPVQSTVRPSTAPASPPAQPTSAPARASSPSSQPQPPSPSAPAAPAPTTPAPVTSASSAPAPQPTASPSPSAPAAPAPTTSIPATPAPATPVPVTSASSTSVPSAPASTPAPVTPASS